jgi:hypothetical protein
MQDPQIRASWPKFVLRCARRPPHEGGAPIVDSVPDELRREIRQVGHLGWIDARSLRALLDIVYRVAGEAGCSAFWRASFKDALTQPLIAPLARGAMTMWGDTPGALVRRTHEAWIFFTRHCGSLRVVPSGEANSIMLVFENLAPVCRTPSFLRMVEGGLESEIDYVHTTGTVETRADQFETHGLAEFIVRWENPPGSQR